MKRWRGWIIIGLGVFIAGRVGMNVWRLYKAGDKVEMARNELAEAQAEQERLKAQLEYVQSDEFVEREAREKLGLGKPGEEVVIVPTPSEIQDSRFKIQEGPNWKKWWKLYGWP
ncbi:septum formation initiator family protein [Candidatus Amesbacteria bacterium]|nr:septum formation initiator family protein [Candidatus Amesbacteria bacterium]MBI2587283.1 septum formation initiator family protein [Candidatus Amesbacteria bacterium]